MDKTTRKRVAARCRRDGFDQTTSGSRGGESYVKPRCSQCSALVIMGTACHETGCPNSKKGR